MIDANGLIKIIDDKSKQPKNIYFGTISDDLRVIFDGEVTPTQKRMACIQYTPVAGDRVVIYKQGQVCLILGNIGPGGGGDTSEIYRARIIQDLLSIGQTIGLDATWDQIDTVISRLYVSGTLLRTSIKAQYFDVKQGKNILINPTFNQMAPMPAYSNLILPFQDLKNFANVALNTIILTTTVAQEQNFNLNEASGYTCDPCITFDGYMEMKPSSGIVSNFSLFSHEVDGDIFSITIDNHNVSRYDSITVSNIDNIPTDTPISQLTTDSGMYTIDTFANMDTGLNLLFSVTNSVGTSAPLGVGIEVEIPIDNATYQSVISII